MDTQYGHEDSGEVDVRGTIRALANDMAQKAPERRRVREEDVYTRPTVSDFEERGTEAQVAALYSALAQARGSFGEIKKTRKVEVKGKDGRLLYPFTYAPMEELLGATTAPLTANGLVLLMPFVTAVDQVTKQLVILAHCQGGRLVFKFEFMPHGDEKLFGGQTTYLQRYCYRSVLVLAADGDMDEMPYRANEDQAVGQDIRRPTGSERLQLRNGKAQAAPASKPANTQAQGSAQQATLLGEMLALAKKVGINKRSAVATFVWDTVNNGQPFGIGDDPFCGELTVEQLEKCLTALTSKIASAK
jgi:hypothetical protein